MNPWLIVLLQLACGFVGAALPGLFVLVRGYFRYPPMWWRRLRSKHTTGSYRWRVYE
jgi:hypothetical protein